MSPSAEGSIFYKVGSLVNESLLEYLDHILSDYSNLYIYSKVSGMDEFDRINIDIRISNGINRVHSRSP